MQLVQSFTTIRSLQNELQFVAAAERQHLHESRCAVRTCTGRDCSVFHNVLKECRK